MRCCENKRDHVIKKMCSFRVRKISEHWATTLLHLKPFFLNNKIVWHVTHCKPPKKRLSIYTFLAIVKGKRSVQWPQTHWIDYPTIKLYNDHKHTGLITLQSKYRNTKKFIIEVTLNPELLLLQLSWTL